MGFTPVLHAFDILLVPEVLLVLRFREPALLAGAFAGPSALRFLAILLLVTVAEIGGEKVFAMQTLRGLAMGLHLGA
jgi:hypothetical protein